MAQKDLRTEPSPEQSDAATALQYPVDDKHKQNYRIVLQQDEDGRFVATCPDLPGVVTDGADRVEAIKNARCAVSDMLDSMDEPNKVFNVSLMPSP